VESAHSGPGASDVQHSPTLDSLNKRCSVQFAAARLTKSGANATLS
jgi:hypothetical protein